MKRTASLTRSKPLGRGRVTRKAPTKYKSRPRATAYMLWVKSLPCLVPDLIWTPDPCEGPVEADHAGQRGLGRKAPDSTCVSLCRYHHRCRTDMSGRFKSFSQGDMREFLVQAIQLTHARARAQGVAIPDC